MNRHTAPEGKIDFKDDYIRYLERKCYELMIQSGSCIEYMNEQTQEILAAKSSMGLNKEDDK